MIIWEFILDSFKRRLNWTSLKKLKGKKTLLKGKTQNQAKDSTLINSKQITKLDWEKS